MNRSVFGLGLLLTSAIANGAQAQDPLFTNDIHRLLPVEGTLGPAATGDFDRDGDLDLLIARRLFLNEGRGSFRDASDRLPLDAWQTDLYETGDLDGDLDLDVVVSAHLYDETWLRFWINDGAGRFTLSPQSLPPTYYALLTSAVALGDVDGDGDLDLVRAENSGVDCLDDCPPGRERLYLNSGGGTFTEVVNAIVGGPYFECPGALQLGDVDADGDLDLLIANLEAYYYDAPHRLLFNDGTGLFLTAAPGLPSGLILDGIPPSAKLADLDQDLDLDVLIGNDLLWLNDGGGVFSDASANIPPGTPRGASAVGDLDGDGRPDFVACGWIGHDAVLLNLGGAQFGLDGGLPDRNEPTRFALLGDLDGDADLDAVIQRWTATEFAFNDGGGRFATAEPLLPPRFGNYRSVAVGDVDGDHLPDVLASDDDQDRLWLNLGNGAFADATANLPAAGDSTRAVALVDIDADGDLDALFANPLQAPPVPDVLCLNDGHGRFTTAPDWWSNAPDRSEALAVADVDGDGDADVLTCNLGGPDRLYFNDGTGRLAEIAGRWPGGLDSTYSAAFADLDGDGDPDVVLGGGGATWFENVGNGTYWPLARQLFVANSITFGLVTLDVDRDHDVDVVCGTNFAPGEGRTLRLFLNDGHGDFTEDLVRLPHTADWISALACADFDGDEDLDLALAGTGSRLLWNDGQGRFTSGAGGSLATGTTYALAAVDTDADGDVDLVCGQSFGSARILVNLTRQLAWSTLPRIGARQVFELRGRPGQAFWFGGSLASRWLPIDGLGVLRIARRQLVHLEAGTLDGSGSRQPTFMVPLDPNLVGHSLYWQALLVGPGAYTNLEITTFVGP